MKAVSMVRPTTTRRPKAEIGAHPRSPHRSTPASPERGYRDRQDVPFHESIFTPEYWFFGSASRSATGLGEFAMSMVQPPSDRAISHRFMSSARFRIILASFP